MKHSRYLPNFTLYLSGFFFQAAVITYFYAHFDAAILRLMPDDAFYYLKIAENIAHGLGSVFSPGEPTNGYHPLWMVVLALADWAAKPGQTQFVMIALGLAVVLNVLAAHLFFNLLRTIGFSAGQSLLGAACYLFLPWMVNLTLTGLETPLFLGFLFLFLTVALRLLKDGIRPTAWDGLKLGVVAGFLLLARTDSVFFVLPAFALILLKKQARSLIALTVGGLVTTLLLSPWLLWNFIYFGTIQQSSSIAIPIINHYLHPAIWTNDYWNFALSNYVGSTYWLFFSPFVTHTKYQMDFAWWKEIAVALPFVAVALLLLFLRLNKRESRLPLILYAPVMALIFFYCAIRLFVQPWHLATLLILAIVYGLNFVPAQRIRPALIFLFVLLMLPVSAYTLRNAYFRPQEWAGRVAYFQQRFPIGLPSPSTVCITDSGIPGYFSPHTIINLDGVVNNQALNYILAGRFSDYTASKHCDIVILDESRLAFYDRNMPRSSMLSH